MSLPKPKIPTNPDRLTSSAGKASATAETTYPKDATRLAKYLAAAGVASRRHCEDLVRAGDVSVNARIIIDPAYPVMQSDIVRYGGRTLVPPSAEKHYVIMLHKPVGVISTMSPGMERGYCLSDLVSTPDRLHPIGRLDQDSSGLILMTNDGALTLRLTHPSHEIEKEYVVRLNRILQPGEYDKIARGVQVDDRVVAVSQVVPVRGGKVSIVIHEGRNRIVRRLFGALNCNVLELKRVRIGPITLGKLGVGKWRKLTSLEYSQLQGVNDDKTH